MIKSVVDKFSQFTEFAHRIETIKVLLAHEHPGIVKEALERELKRSTEMMDDALGESIRRSMQEAHQLWTRPAGTVLRHHLKEMVVIDMTTNMPFKGLSLIDMANQQSRHSDPERDKRIFNILRRVDLSKVAGLTPKPVTHMELKINNIPVDISGLSAPAFKVSAGAKVAEELKKAAKGEELTKGPSAECFECAHLKSCHPEAGESTPEEFKTSITIDTKTASVDDLWDAVVNLQVELFRRGAANR